MVRNKPTQSKPETLDTGESRYDDDDPANLCKFSFHFGFSLGDERLKYFLTYGANRNWNTHECVKTLETSGKGKV